MAGVFYQQMLVEILVYYAIDGHIYQINDSCVIISHYYYYYIRFMISQVS